MRRSKLELKKSELSRALGTLVGRTSGLPVYITRVGQKSRGRIKLQLSGNDWPELCLLEGL